MKGKPTTPDEARRIARVIASDILLYNKKKVREGLVKDSLFDVLADEIAEGKRYFLSRIDESLGEAEYYFNEALVEYLLVKNEDCEKIPWLRGE